MSLRVGDRANPQWVPGSTEVGSANPQTTFPRPPSQLGTFCVGCNGPKPSITILFWSGLPLRAARVMVARVSLGVDATDPNTVFTDGNSILVEIWFARTANPNRPPAVDAGPNQTVEVGQTATLRGTVQDPDGNPLVLLWTSEHEIGGSGITINDATSLVASFTAPSEPGDLTFQLCADDGKASPVCDTTQVSVVPPAPAITSISPESAPSDSRITINGSGFAVGEAVVFFDGIPGLEVDLQSDSKILATIPTGLKPGPVNITVTTAGGSATLLGGLDGFSLEKKLYFAQFGNGDGFTADLVFINPSTTESVFGTAAFLDDDGLPLLVGIATKRAPRVEGPVKGAPPLPIFRRLPFFLAPHGSVTFSTDGKGELVSGSVVVTADRELAGVIRFYIPDVGITGVGESLPLNAFIIPARRTLDGINTGVGIHNPESESISVALKLRRNGEEVAQARVQNLPPGGHVALFIDQIFPNADTDDFNGTLVALVDDGKRVAATALELGSEPGEFTTLPVQPLQ